MSWITPKPRGTGRNFLSTFCDVTVILYAMWKSTMPTTMQGFGDYCGQMQVDQVLTLIDTRDNNNYTIAKLKDEKCWMTTNIKIQSYILKGSDSNVSTQYELPAANSGSSSYTSPYITVSDGDLLYNWAAATAGTGKPGMEGDSDAPDSLCPKGWYLPNKTIYTNLTSKYYATVSALISPPPSFTVDKSCRLKYSTGDNCSVYWSSSYFCPKGCNDDCRNMAYTLTIMNSGTIYSGNWDSGIYQTATAHVRCLTN